MPQSLSNIAVHLVFSTKYRQPLILPEYEKEIFSYMAGILNETGNKCLNVGGYIDHVHCLFKLNKVQNVSKVVEVLKSNSSKWIKTLDKRLENFYWQNGYAIFSVDYRGIPKVYNYIANQRVHHQRKSYRAELLETLKENEIEFDEKYLWD